MKHYQLILAAAIVAIAGCNKVNIETVDETESNEIGFNAVTRVATKANGAIISGTTYGHENTFKVWGWQSAASDFSEFADNATSNFMSGLTISWTKGRDNTRAEAWRNATNYYYWPMTGKISFLAIHPSDVTPTSTGWDATNDKPVAAFADYTISASNKTVDLMFATNEGSRQADALAMVFKHALSQIQFRIRTDADYSSDVTFAVNSIAINNIDLSGDLAYANEAFTWSDNANQTESWTYYSTSQNAAYPTNGLDANAATYGDANVMIPQAANTLGTEDTVQTTLTINYTMTQTGSSAITGNVTVAAPHIWEAGSKYVYTINFELNEILFNPSATDWTTVNIDTFDISL